MDWHLEDHFKVQSFSKLGLSLQEAQLIWFSSQAHNLIHLQDRLASFKLEPKLEFLPLHGLKVIEVVQACTVGCLRGQRCGGEHAMKVDVVPRPSP